MSVYALSLLENYKKLPDKVSLYFVDSLLIGEEQKDKNDIERVKQEIRQVADGISNNNFEAKPGWGECGRCAYRDICPFTQTDV